jgi:hypothetical protein
MPSTSFEPFRVYSLNENNPNTRILPYDYFLCITSSPFLEPFVNFNVVGLPVLTRQGRIVDKRLRLPLRTLPGGELSIANGPIAAIDLLQPLNKDMLNPAPLGHLMEREIDELKSMMRAFLSIC